MPSLTLTAAIGLALASTSVAASELVVLSAGAVKAALAESAAQWQKRGTHTVKASFAPAGELRKRLAAREFADVLVIPVENLAMLERDGVIVPGTRHDLGMVATAAAVKKGAPVPDVSTIEGLRKALLEAKSVTYMDPKIGTSGRNFDEGVLPKLGIRDEVRAKTVFGEGGYIAEKVARGEVDIAFHNVTEILPVQGVTIAGLLPKELQQPIVYSGVVMSGAKDPAAARALLDYMVSPEGRKPFLDRGFTAP
ncbi:MAG TPA: substrate-binding domain-containing protein [Usitatibacter sp.]|jgi:molybdate transport system substrate-binding protein|nr:substrate-binding domain-containing protein [Usitatibacter sp.]